MPDDAAAAAAAAQGDSADPFANFDDGFDAPLTLDGLEAARGEAPMDKAERRKARRRRERAERKAARVAAANDNGEAAREAAELELLMLPNDGKAVESAPAERTDVLADDRFKALLENDEFAVDPTARQFRESGGMRRVMRARAERQAELRAEAALERKSKRRRGEADGDKSAKKKKRQQAAGDADADTAAKAAKQAASVASVIARVKGKQWNKGEKKGLIMRKKKTQDF